MPFRKMASELYLDTRSCTNTHTDGIYDISWSINDVRLNAMSGFQLSLQGGVISNMVYPINETCNCFYFLVGATPYTATIPPGNYTSITIGPALVAAMGPSGAGGGTFTAAIDANTDKLTLTRTAATWSLSTGANSIHEKLGFDPSTQTSAAAAQTGLWQINLSGTTAVDFLMNLSTFNYNASAGRATFARVPLQFGYGYVFPFTIDNAERTAVTNPDLSTLKLVLLDDRGNYWKLPPNAILSLIFRIEPISIASDTSTAALSNGTLDLLESARYVN